MNIPTISWGRAGVIIRIHKTEPRSSTRNYRIIVRYLSAECAAETFHRTLGNNNASLSGLSSVAAFACRPPRVFSALFEIFSHFVFENYRLHIVPGFESAVLPRASSNGCLCIYFAVVAVNWSSSCVCREVL